MELDDYRTLLPVNNKLSEGIVDLLKLHRKFDINIAWTEHNDKCDPELKKIFDEIEKKYKTNGSI